MLSRITLNIAKRSICNNAYMLYQARDSSQLCSLTCVNNAKQYNIQNQCNLYIVKRFKSSRKKTDNRKHIDEDSDEEQDNMEEPPVGSKIFSINVQSLRLDIISKVGFGISRNKIEEAFYASRIRLNGKKVLKKSRMLDVRDEIDLILHRNVDNPMFLNINRIVVLAITPASNDNIQIKLSRDKNLLIEDYMEPWSSE